MSFPIAVHSESTTEYRPVSRGLAFETETNVIDLASKVFADWYLKKTRTLPQAKAPRAALVASHLESLAKARDAKTSPQVLQQLAADLSDDVRIELIYNPSSPLLLIKELAMDKNRFIAAQARVRLADVA